VRILRNCPFIGLVCLLFLSCGGKKEAGVSSDQEENNHGNQSASASDPKEKSVQFLKLQAEEGLRDAQYQYAYHLVTGQGVEEDLSVARQWFTKAADQGHTEAQYRLALIILQGKEDGISKPADAAEWFLKAANGGHVDAQFNLGRLCLDGRGVTQNSDKALAWIKLAATQSHTSALFLLGRMNENGQGTTKDPAVAYSLYEKAAKQGHPAAQYKLALMLRDGIGINVDKTESNKWFRVAESQGLPKPRDPQNPITPKDTQAESGPEGPAGPLPKVGSRENTVDEPIPAKSNVTNPASPTTISKKPQHEFLRSPRAAKEFQEEQEEQKSDIASVEYKIAENFAEGAVIAPNPQKAREYYQRSAEKGHAEALYKLGMEYLAPPSAGAPDPANAIVWLERAAAQGHPASQNQLGEIYYGGLLGPPDYKKAYWWHWLAASNNQHPDSQNKIGEMYLLGQGINQDTEMASRWFEKAATQGHESAANNLRSLQQATRIANAKKDAVNNPPTLSPDAWLERGLRLYRSQTPSAENFREAYQCFSNAALGGKKEAHYYIGLMLDYGQGIQPKPEKAYENYLVAARDGYARAQFNLGFLYESGRGTRKLLTEAYVWYTIAGESGMKGAVRTREELARKMKPYEVSYAQQRLTMLKKLLAGE
jgi:TPR repeat protein